MKLLQMIGKTDTQKDDEPQTTAEIATAVRESDPSIDSFFPGFLESNAFIRIAEICSFSEIQQCLYAMTWVKAGWQKIPQIAHNQATHRQDIKRSKELRERAYKSLREAAQLEGLSEGFYLPAKITDCKEQPSEPVTAGNLNERWGSLTDYQKDWITHTFNKSTPEGATGFEATYNRFFSELGGASNPEGAAKGAAVRFLDEYITARVKADKKDKRYSIIARLLKLSGVEVTPQYVRSTLNRS